MITHRASDHTQAAAPSRRRRRMRSGDTGSAPGLPAAARTALPVHDVFGHDGPGGMPCGTAGTAAAGRKSGR